MPIFFALARKLFRKRIPIFSRKLFFFFFFWRDKVMAARKGRASQPGARNGNGTLRVEDGQRINKWAVATQAIELDSFHGSEFWKSYKVRNL